MMPSKVYCHQNVAQIYELHRKTIEATNHETTILKQLLGFGDTLMHAWMDRNLACINQINNWHPDYLGKDSNFIFNAYFELSDARLSIAKDCGFDNWEAVDAQAATKFNLAFEKAVDTLLAGDLEALKTQISQYPELIHLRSTYGHQATLLHYAGSNGVEMWRQQTPYNLPEIVQFLLAAGADKNAKMKVYGGEFTTLEMVVTSAHPHGAGVVEALKKILAD